MFSISPVNCCCCWYHSVEQNVSQKRAIRQLYERNRVLTSPCLPCSPTLKGFICQFSVSSLLIMGKSSKKKIVAEFEVSAFGRVTNIGQICSKCFQVLFWPLRLLFCRLSVARIRLSLFRISTSFLVPVRKYPALVIWAVFVVVLQKFKSKWGRLETRAGVARKRRILLQWWLMMIGKLI